MTGRSKTQIAIHRPVVHRPVNLVFMHGGAKLVKFLDGQMGLNLLASERRLSLAKFHAAVLLLPGPDKQSISGGDLLIMGSDR